MLIETIACPDCETGWRYADELGSPRLTEGRGLVRCPTCQGKGHLRRSPPQRRHRRR